MIIRDSHLDFFKNLVNAHFCHNVDLSQYTTMQTQSSGSLVIVKSQQSLSLLLKFLKKNDYPYQVIGWGANTILPTKLDKLLIKLDFAVGQADQGYQASYQLPASYPVTKLTKLALKYQLAGWERLTGIPASLGGAIYMNAGTKFGEISELITDVHIMDHCGEIRCHQITKNCFSYRRNHFVRPGDIIVSATITHLGQSVDVKNYVQAYAQYRKKTQPLSSKNCGCVFKNLTKDLPAGKYIDILGLTGLSVNGIKVSSVHGNFFENFAEATAQDYWQLSKTVQEISQYYWDQNLQFEAQYEPPATKA